MDNHLTIKNLDHLGIVAGIVDELGLVEVINTHVGEDPREVVSAGVAVKAMILNGLGFASAPLYLFEQFFAGKPTEHLLGEGILASHLNDDRLGRVLDALYVCGITSLFLSISLAAVKRFNITCARAHLDATSMSVTGAYLGPYEPGQLAATVPIHLCHGYSRDHRPDLKQFVINLVCWGDGDIPAFLELADGNQSDKTRFASILTDFQQQWTFEGVYVADSALYSADNLKQLGALQWISRVPLTLTQAQALLTDIDESAFVDTQLAGYRIAQVGCIYAGIRQRWLVVESAHRKAADLKQLENRLDKATQKAQTRLDQLMRQPFACQADAQQALEQFEKKLKQHRLTDLSLVQKAHYEKPGRPAKDAIPTAFTYHIQATLTLNIEQVEQQKRQAGRFILATNGLTSPAWDLQIKLETDAIPLKAEQVLSEYKDQQGTERGFRFLKDPLFFTSSVFLNSPERIMALAMVMTLCLMVYNLAQRRLRTALKDANDAIPNQLGKLTNTPTLRWVFQAFMAVHWVSLNGQTQIANLNDLHLKILRFLGSASQSYYLLC